jgi:type IV pilus biogenesis protein CpaD/CtpE
MKPLALALLVVVAAASADAQAVADRADTCDRAAAPAARSLPFGCANALNLRAMIADPADLRAAGAAPAPVGEPALRAIQRHRDGSPRPLPSAGSTEAPGDPGAR